MQLTAQNLVPNGSFEERTECIFNDSNVEFTPPWYNVQPGLAFVSATPDTFHECMVVNEEPCPYPEQVFLDPWFAGVPVNAVGCESPNDGEGYAGIFCFIWNPDPVDGYREYLSVPLSEELINGETYDVSLWASLAERTTHAIWNLQVLFTEGSVEQGLNAQPLSNLEPQLNGIPGEYIDTRDGWQELSWEYTADGGESHITIGNFELNSQTDTLRVVFGDMENHYFPSTYYYIDNVSVTKQTLSVDDKGKVDINFYPNPVLDFLTITNSRDIISIALYAIDGSMVLKSLVSAQEATIKMTNLDSGIYLLQAQFSDGSITIEKIVKR